MKKLFLVTLIFAMLTVGAFALDKGDFPTGSWIDENWNGEWFFSVEEIQLKDSVTGELIFAFTDDVISNFKLTPSTKGLTLSFYCAETERDYKFTKPITLSTDLDMEINPDWTDEDYKVAIKFSKISF